MNIDAPSFKQAMRECAGAVALVTVGTAPGQRTGLTVTSACSLSDKPPSLIACVNRNASAHARICEERAFAVNFLHEEHALLALTFSGQKGINGDDRFAFCRCRLRLRADAGIRNTNPFDIRRRSAERVGVGAEYAPALSPRKFPRRARDQGCALARRRRCQTVELERFFLTPVRIAATRVGYSQTGGVTRRS
jgi:hypothetical protein